MDEVARGTSLTDQGAMTLAIAVAKKGAGYVSPNPCVGCVILDSQGRLLQTGYHAKYGGPHAEIQALAGLPPEQLKGARIFVTLEPCAHQGKTPSCAKALTLLPIAEVVYGLVDPNPLVAGQGAEILRQAGIRATLWNRDQDDLEEVCEHFLENFRYQRPWVSLKVAVSLDGKLALRSGESKWITGPESRQAAHALRASHDALLVGAQTVLVDNPQLNIRHPAFPGLRKKIVVLDWQGHVGARADLHLWQAHSAADIVLVQGPGAAKLDSGRTGVNLVQGLTRRDNGRVLLDLKETLINLRKLGIQSILVEGGAQSLSSFITAQQANRLYLFQAPVLLGGASGVTWTEAVTIHSMSQRIALRAVRRMALGADELTTGLFERNA